MLDFRLDFDAGEFAGELRDAMWEEVQRVTNEAASGVVCPVHQKSPTLTWPSAMPKDGNFKIEVEACCEAVEGLLEKALESENADEGPDDDPT